MPSFRTRVLEALDIKKNHVRIPCYQTFPQPNPARPQLWDPADEVTTTSNTSSSADPPTNDLTTSTMQNYAISKVIRTNTIGPKSKKDRIEVLGFVVGHDPGSATVLPDAVDRSANQVYTGMHYLGGIYDSTNRELQAMRKSGVKHLAHQSMHDPGGQLAEHTHTDWPSDAAEQAIKLNEDPYCDSLFFHNTSIRFFLTGLDDVNSGNAAGHSMGDLSANHRGTVRMLILRPRVPKVNMRTDGTSSSFILNHDYLPDWETELFYDRKKQLGGRLKTDCEPHTVDSTNTYGSIQTPNRSTDEHSNAIVSYGLDYHAKVDPEVEYDFASVHYGYQKKQKDTTAHGLTPFDILTSPINTKKFAVLEDSTFTLDSLHHGAAAHHIVNVNIPYNKKVRFAGRKPEYTTDNNNVVTYTGGLTEHTFDEPLNLASRPIILFLSYNQRISAQVEGYTAVSET